ncbi:flagellar biosynthetic protein FliO [Microbacterium candidum]|uniref:Flagellar biosynthetic protein FliO n=1 Tax=Microbacterium candidum TaxID=3041922 RepID=A0ABT7MTU3_9MICO|nr:flagellar biosynthetic protein FliO [Microbacterium sp. ASV49]MDL9977864.1 flagellar biosynthetic protein FliO [Microbacterium sp. ASV49]
MGDLLLALRTIVALAAVLGLLLWLNRRLQKGKAAGGNPFAALLPKKLKGMGAILPARQDAGPRPRAEKITVVARSGLGGKAQLVVAEFDGIRYVLGVTEHGVNVVDTQETIPADVAEEIAQPEVDAGPIAKTRRALKSVA